MTSLSWKPIKRGDTYCSPGCGVGCKRSDYEKAVRSAEAICKKLGNGFKPHVWENLGWHWDVRM